MKQTETRQNLRFIDQKFKNLSLSYEFSNKSLYSPTTLSRKQRRTQLKNTCWIELLVQIGNWYWRNRGKKGSWSEIAIHTQILCVHGKPFVTWNYELELINNRYTDKIGLLAGPTSGAYNFPSFSLFPAFFSFSLSFSHIFYFVILICLQFDERIKWRKGVENASKWRNLKSICCFLLWIVFYVWFFYFVWSMILIVYCSFYVYLSFVT